MERTIIKKMKKAVAVFMAVNMLLTFADVSSINCDEYGVMLCAEELEESAINMQN